MPGVGLKGARFDRRTRWPDDTDPLALGAVLDDHVRCAGPAGTRTARPPRTCGTKRAFVIRPFGKKKDLSGREIDFDWVHCELIAPALVAAGLSVAATGDADAGSGHEQMLRSIIEADLVVCDVTLGNANVFYELGVRHALRREHSVLSGVRPRQRANRTPCA